MDSCPKWSYSPPAWPTSPCLLHLNRWRIPWIMAWCSRHKRCYRRSWRCFISWAGSSLSITSRHQWCSRLVCSCSASISLCKLYSGWLLTVAAFALRRYRRSYTLSSGWGPTFTQRCLHCSWSWLCQWFAVYGLFRDFYCGLDSHVLPIEDDHLEVSVVAHDQDDVLVSALAR